MSVPAPDPAPSPARSRPSWIRVRAPRSAEADAIRALMREKNLNTVCEEAACPNMGECWSRKHATFMVLGRVCTRACRFCNIETGRPDLLDPHEPDHVAEAVARMQLQHVVITSVDRDDLPDGGAAHFAETIRKVRALNPATTIEVLTPDFRGKQGAEHLIVATRPDVFNHNLETVPRLYASVRPGARYFHSLRLLESVKKASPEIFTKSGLMVGLGETFAEVCQVMDDLRSADVDFLTLGQYLQPTPAHQPVMDYISPEQFEEYARMARGKGFLMVAASPLTRSSYHAGEDFQTLQKARKASRIQALPTQD